MPPDSFSCLETNDCRYLDTFQEISSIENFFSELSTRISDCSVTTALTKNSYRISNESSEEELNKAWNKVRSSALATQYHVNAAAEYHQFNFKCDRLRYLLNRSWSQMGESTKGYRDPDSTIFSTKTADFGSFLHDKLGEIKKHLTELDRLRIVSKSITPLHRAVQPPEAAKEFEGVILCDFLDELNKIYLRRGQRVKVLETGRPTVNTSTVTTDEPPPLKFYWIVQGTTQEKPIKIPSVYVGLTKDDSDSTDRALCIYEQFFDSWSDQIDEWLSTGVLHFISFLDEVTRNKDLCFEDPDKVSHLLTELELSFPQKEGAETNDEVWNKIAMVRAELRNREEISQTCLENSTPATNQQLDGYFLVLKNLKAQMRYYNSAKSRFRKEKYADDLPMEQTMQRFEQFAAEVEHLASELERVRDELSSMSMVQRLQEGLDHGSSNIASDLYDKSGGHVVLQREETSSFESLHREFEEPWHRIRRTAIEVQRIVNVNALKTRRTVRKDRESDLSSTVTPFDRVFDKCQGRLHTSKYFEVINTATMTSISVSGHVPFEDQMKAFTPKNAKLVDKRAKPIGKINLYRRCRSETIYLSEGSECEEKRDQIIAMKERGVMRKSRNAIERRNNNINLKNKSVTVRMQDAEEAASIKWPKAEQRTTATQTMVLDLQSMGISNMSGHRLIKDAGMSAVPVADFFNLETKVSTLIAIAGSQTLEQLSLVPITELKIKATPMAESSIKASDYSAIYSAPPVNRRLISTGVMSSMPVHQCIYKNSRYPYTAVATGATNIKYLEAAKSVRADENEAIIVDNKGRNDKCTDEAITTSAITQKQVIGSISEQTLPGTNMGEELGIKAEPIAKIDKEKKTNSKCTEIVEKCTSTQPTIPIKGKENTKKPKDIQQNFHYKRTKKKELKSTRFNDKNSAAERAQTKSAKTELEAPEKVATVKVKGMMVDTLRENVGPCMTCTATQTQAWLSVAETTGNLAIPARASCRVKEIGVLATSVVRLFDLETQVTPMSVHAQCQTLSPLSLLSSPILPTSHAPAAAMVKSKSLQTCLDEASALKSVEMHATAAMVYTQVECASSSWLADAEMPRQFEGADYAALLRPRNEAEGYECVHASPRLVEMQHAYRITSQPSCIDTGMNTGVATVQHSFLPPLHGNTADVYADVVTTTQSIATVTTQTMAGVLIDSETQVTHLVTHCQCQTVTPLTTETVMPVVADSSRLEVTPVVVAEEEGIIEPLSYAHIHSAAPVAVQLRSTAVMTSLPIDKSREEEWMSKSCIVCGGVARPVDSRSTTTELEAPEKVATVKVKGMMVDTLRENVGPCMTCTATQTQAWLSVAETTGILFSNFVQSFSSVSPTFYISRHMPCQAAPHSSILLMNCLDGFANLIVDAVLCEAFALVSFPAESSSSLSFLTSDNVSYSRVSTTAMDNLLDFFVVHSDHEYKLWPFLLSRGTSTASFVHDDGDQPEPFLLGDFTCTSVETYLKSVDEGISKSDRESDLIPFIGTDVKMSGFHAQLQSHFLRSSLIKPLKTEDLTESPRHTGVLCYIFTDRCSHSFADIFGSPVTHFSQFTQTDSVETQSIGVQAGNFYGSLIHLDSGDDSLSAVEKYIKEPIQEKVCETLQAAIEASCTALVFATPRELFDQQKCSRHIGTMASRCIDGFHESESTVTTQTHISVGISANPLNEDPGYYILAVPKRVETSGQQTTAPVCPEEYQVIKDAKNEKENLRRSSILTSAILLEQSTKGVQTFHTNMRYAAMMTAKEVKCVTDSDLSEETDGGVDLDMCEALLRPERHIPTSSTSVIIKALHPPISSSLVLTQISKSSVTSAAQTCEVVEPSSRSPLLKASNEDKSAEQKTTNPLQMESLPVQESCPRVKGESLQCLLPTALVNINGCTQTMGPNMRCISTMTCEEVKCDTDGETSMEQKTMAPLQAEPAPIEEQCLIVKEDSLQCFVPSVPPSISSCTQTVGCVMRCSSSMTSKEVRSDADGEKQPSHTPAMTSFDYAAPISVARPTPTDSMCQAIQVDRIQTDATKVLMSCAVQTRISVEILTRVFEDAHSHPHIAEKFVEVPLRRQPMPIQLSFSDAEAKYDLDASLLSLSDKKCYTGTLTAFIESQAPHSSSSGSSIGHSTGKTLRCVAMMTAKEVKCVTDSDLSEETDGGVDLDMCEALLRPERHIPTSSTSVIIKALHPPISSSLVLTQISKSSVTSAAQTCKVVDYLSISPIPIEQQASMALPDVPILIEESCSIVKEDSSQCFVPSLPTNINLCTQTVGSTLKCTSIMTSALSSSEYGALIRPTRHNLFDAMCQTIQECPVQADAPKVFVSCAAQTQVSVEILTRVFEGAHSYPHGEGSSIEAPLKRQSSSNLLLSSGAIEHASPCAVDVTRQLHLHGSTQTLRSELRSTSAMTALEVRFVTTNKAVKPYISSDKEFISFHNLNLMQTYANLLSCATQTHIVVEPSININEDDYSYRYRKDGHLNPLVSTGQQTATKISKGLPFLVDYYLRNIEEVCNASGLSRVSNFGSSSTSLSNGSSNLQLSPISHVNNYTQTSIFDLRCVATMTSEIIKCALGDGLFHGFVPGSETKAMNHGPRSSIQHSLIQTTTNKAYGPKSVQTHNYVKSAFGPSVMPFEGDDYAALIRSAPPLIQTGEKSNLVDDQVVELLHAPLASSQPTQKAMQQDAEIQVNISIKVWLEGCILGVSDDELNECILALMNEQFRRPSCQRAHDISGFKQHFNRSCQTAPNFNLAQTSKYKEADILSLDKACQTGQVQVISTHHKEEREDWSQECVEVEKEIIQIEDDLHQPSESRISYLLEKSLGISRVVHVFRLRVRILEYELCDDFKRLLTPSWQKMIEVANQKTGVFTPMAIALHRKWVHMSDQHPHYVDSIRGKNLPFEKAFSLGYVRLASLPKLLDPRGPLIFIERESFGWHSVRGYGYVRSVNETRMEFEEAWRAGFIRRTGNGTRVTVWDDHLSMWIPAEEAVAKNVLLVSTNRDFKVSKVRRKLFRVSAIRPGGLQGQWLNPLEALTYGMFEWQKGNVADTWLAQPRITQPTLSEAIFVPPTQEFIPLSWKCFYEAWKEGWVRLTQEPNADMVSVTDFDNRRVVKTFMNLVVNPLESTNRSLSTHLSFGHPWSGAEAKPAPPAIAVRKTTKIKVNRKQSRKLQYYPLQHDDFA